MKRVAFGTILLVWLGSAGFSPGAAKVYIKAVQFAKAGQDHFAFMQYNNLLRSYPLSKYRDEALFALGEYYFQTLSLGKAEAAFVDYLDENPDSQERMYALAYLHSIAVKKGAPVEDIRREIINFQQVSFIFRETKEITYRSPLYKNYRTVIHIDKIEFYVEGELFAQVSY